jgi:hypothetical protein
MQRGDQLFGLAATRVDPQGALGVGGGLFDPALRLAAAGQLQVFCGGLARAAGLLDQPGHAQPLIVGVGLQPQHLAQRLDRAHTQPPLLLQIGQLRVDRHSGGGVAHSIVRAGQVFQKKRIILVTATQLFKNLQGLRVFAGIEQSDSG